MNINRLEAFSDGVLAIIITIMVLELKVPHGDTLNDLASLIPVFMSYLLSFIYIGIYWNNHHHLIKTASKVTGPILWANLHLLFWLSLIPFATGWLGENHFAPVPAAVYGGVLLMAAIAFFGLQQSILASKGTGSILHQVLGTDWKGKISPILYVIGIVTVYWSQWISIGIYILVALIWIIPDRRFERAVQNDES